MIGITPNLHNNWCLPLFLNIINNSLSQTFVRCFARLLRLIRLPWDLWLRFRLSTISMMSMDEVREMFPLPMILSFRPISHLQFFDPTQFRCFAWGFKLFMWLSWLYIIFLEKVFSPSAPWMTAATIFYVRAYLIGRFILQYTWMNFTKFLKKVQNLPIFWPRDVRGHSTLFFI